MGRQKKKDPHAMIKLYIGVMQLQVKKCQKLPTNHQKLERDTEGLTYSFQTEHGPDNNVIFGPLDKPEL